MGVLGDGGGPQVRPADLLPSLITLRSRGGPGTSGMEIKTQNESLIWWSTDRSTLQIILCILYNATVSQLHWNQKLRRCSHVTLYNKMNSPSLLAVGVAGMADKVARVKRHCVSQQDLEVSGYKVTWCAVVRFNHLLPVYTLLSHRNNIANSGTLKSRPASTS